MLNKRVIKVIVCSVAVALLLGACVLSNTNESEYRPLSEEELSEFLNEKNITHLDVRIIGDATVILYETTSEMGYYTVAVKKNGKLSTQKVHSNNNSNYTPVSLGWTSTGVPFAKIIINDETILKEAYKVLVKFENGDEVTELVNDRKGLLIPNEKVKNDFVGVDYIQIFDKGGASLYRSK